MSDPYTSLEHYRPGAGAQSWSITDACSSPPVALTEGWWYEVRATVAADIAVAALTSAASTAGEYLGAAEWSLSFQVPADCVLGIKGSGGGTAYVRRVGYGYRG